MKNKTVLVLVAFPAFACAQPAQVVKPPIALYWMSVETAAGMGMPGMGAGGAAMAGMMMGGRGAQGGRSLHLQLGSQNAAADAPRAERPERSAEPERQASPPPSAAPDPVKEGIKVLKGIFGR